MLSIPWTQEMIENAQSKAQRLGEINNSITKGRGNIAGFLGEEAVAAHFGAEIVSCDAGDEKYNYDLWKNGKRIEVKTKRRTAPPLDYYDVSVAKTSEHQRPDLYVFVSLQFSRSQRVDGHRLYYGLQGVWVVGVAGPDDYFARAEFWAKGREDEANGFITKVDMYNLPINQLTAPSQVLV
jgi:hypothetical protein